MKFVFGLQEIDDWEDCISFGGLHTSTAKQHKGNIPGQMHKPLQ